MNTYVPPASYLSISAGDNHALRRMKKETPEAHNDSQRLTTRFISPKESFRYLTAA